MLIDVNKIYNCDCIDGLKNLSDERALPYGGVKDVQ